MVRTKQKKYLASHEDERIFQAERNSSFDLQGRWHRDFFVNEHPLVLELACGYGEYTTGLAQQYSERNFVGVDLKGDRLCVGSRTSKDLGLGNTAFVRTQIENLETIFAEDEVDDIWIIHPDPRPKQSDTKRRLTSDRFLKIYSHILKDQGTLRLKTDDIDLFHYSLESCLKNNWQLTSLTFDLYESDLLEEHHDITTRYEKKFTEEGRKIHYAVWQRK